MWRRRSVAVLFVSTAATTFAILSTRPQRVMNSGTSIVDSLLAENNIVGESGSSLALTLRKIEVFALATRVVADYKILQWRSAQMNDGYEKDQLWEEAHTRNAKLLYRSFSKLEALWIKLGQYLSSRADVMPKPFLEELQKCQDSLPAPEWDETRSTIEKELNGPVEKFFSFIEPQPMAVASIASVHRAILHDGTDVVVKVQHSTVRSRLLQDLKCLETIGDTVRWLDKDFDFSPVIREWSKEVPKELDFRTEARNMERVAANLAPFRSRKDSLKIDASLASVIPGLTSEKVLVMGMIDGVKVDDQSALDALQVDRQQLMLDITRAYAQQIFSDGFFSGDPHPGNLLVDRKTLSPVLLDFGLTKEISEELKFAFSKMIVAADENDLHGLTTALEAVGLKLRPEVPFDISLLSKYFFREARPAAEAQEENAKRRADWKQQAEEKARVLYVGDKVDVTTKNLIGWRTERKGEVLAAGADTLDVVFSSDDSVEKVDRSSAKLQKSRSPIDGWPDAFIFFERVLGLLRGLTASLDVSQSYLTVMTPYARLSLANHPLATQPRADPLVGEDALGGSISSILRAGVASGDLLGAQVCVMRNNDVLINLAAGVADPYSGAQVDHDTRFCVFSLSKAVAAAAVQRLVLQGKVSLSDPVCKHWKAFAANGKEKITIADVLGHRAGLANAATEDLALDPLLAQDSERILGLMESAAPDPALLGKVAYHYLTFGWLLDGLVRSVEGVTLDEYAKSSFGLGFGIGGMDMEGVDTNAATLVLKRFEIPSPSSTSAPAPAAATETPAAVDAQRKRPPGAASLLMNPTYFNNPKIRAASIPSANGHYSAAQLARFYCSKDLGAVASELKKAGSVSGEQSTASGEKLLQGEEGKFRLGFMMYSDEGGRMVFGHSGLGGSVGLCCKDLESGDQISIAVTLNRLSFDAKQTRQIVRTVFAELGLPVPEAFMKP